nr:hypothetical protein [Tanacetum cinerariifolium]
TFLVKVVQVSNKVLSRSIEITASYEGCEGCCCCGDDDGGAIGDRGGVVQHVMWKEVLVVVGV